MQRDFFYDIVCPYAYMAFIYLRKYDVFVRKNIALKPILLGGLFKHQSVETNPNQTMPKVKASYIKTDIERQSKFFGAPLKFHPRHPVSTLKAMRLILAVDEKQREDITNRLYMAYWQENLDIDDDSVMARVAKEFGVSESYLLDDALKDDLYRATENAFLQKVFGVPSLIFDDRLYFGGDRLLLLKDKLDIPWPDVSWRKSDEVIDFYFDFSSPYSYLAWQEVKIAATCGVKFNLIPVLLGALFKEIGVNNIPMLAAHSNKTAYIFQDMALWAEHRKANFKFNSHFPLRTVIPLRLALLDNAVVDLIFEAAWVRDKDVGDPKVIRSLLNDNGFLGDKLLARAEEDDIKTRLKASTASAIERGVFGLPTFFVKGQKFFGQDRFSAIRQVLLTQ